MYFLHKVCYRAGGDFIVLCYTAPHLSYNLKVVWAAVTFICLGMSQTVFSISKDSLRPN